jgi:hypothetical protein
MFYLIWGNSKICIIIKVSILIRYSEFCCLGHSVLVIWRLWTLISPIVHWPVAYFSSASIRTYLSVYRALKFKSLVYGIFHIGQPDKNIGNLGKWPIYVISVCLLIVVSKAYRVVFLICLSSSCVLCTQCCQFLWYAHCWFPLGFL